MDKHFKNQLNRWCYDEIKANPKKFGGDFGNQSIMHEYLMQFYGDAVVIQLEPNVMSILSTVSRIRNKLLEKHPEFDYRMKYAISRKNKNAVGNNS